MIRLRALTPLLLALSIASSAEVTIFVGAAGAPGNVWILNEVQTLPPTILPELTGIQLLALDVVGRTQLNNLRQDAPHLLTVPGGSRVVLPSGRSLYRYSRALPAGGVQYGYFSVEETGRARPLGELPGTGPGRDMDPLVGRLALSPSADSVLLATRMASGGQLYELNLNTGIWTLRTATLPAQRYQLDGLCLTASFGAALTNGGLVRFDRTHDAQATQVSFAGVAPAWIGGEIVCSANGSTIAFSAGDSSTRAFVYVAHATGDATRISNSPQQIVDAGFLPGTAAGPRMALSPDGKIAAWVVQQADSREVFVVNTGAPTPTDVHVTRGQNFEDTLNDSGVIAFVSLEELVLVAGESDGEALPGIEEAEIFSVDFSDSTSDPTVANLSQTLSSTQPPFNYGRLTTEDGIFMLSTGEILAHDPGDALVAGTIISVSSAGPQTLFQQAYQLEWAENVGAHTLVKVQLSESGPSNLLDVDPNGSVSVATAPELHLSRHAVRTQNGWLAAVLTDSAGGEYLGRVGSAGQGGTLLVPYAAEYGPTVGFTPLGSVVASLTMQNGALFLVWPESGPPRPLWPSTLPGFVLPSN